jgi:cellulose synthase/poly-beta-1,6-N-acetylglucosamine synthase-like glycosyltransferase
MGCAMVVALATIPDNMKAFWICLSWYFSATGVFIAIGLLYVVYQSEIALAAMATYEALGLICIMGLAIICYWENFLIMLVFGVHYILLTPTYINILSVFAMCRTDDVTWGTRGKEEKGSSNQDIFKWKKTLFLAIYAVCNIAICACMQL